MDNKETITINKKLLTGIAPAIGIIAVLLAKDKAPEVLLFIIGIAIGVYIGANLKVKKDANFKEENLSKEIN